MTSLSKWNVEKVLAAIGGAALVGGLGAFAYIYVSVSTLLTQTADIKLQLAEMRSSIIPKSEVQIMFQLRDEKITNQGDKIQNHEDRISKLEGKR